MSRKRNRRGGGGAQRWDVLPWKAIEPPLERDDGWQSMGGEEQALLYTLEEISGSDYCLQEDALGGSQMVPAPTAPAPGGEAANAGAVPPPAVGGDEGGDGGGNGDKKTTSKKKKGKKRKAGASEEQAASGAGEGGPAVAGAPATAAASASSDGKPSAAAATAAEGGSATSGGERGVETGAAMEGSDSEATTANSSKGPKKKRRRGQGKKKRAAEAALARETAAAATSAAADPADVPGAGSGGSSDGGKIGAGGGAAPASVAAAGVAAAAVSQQQQQEQHAGERTAEVATAAAAAASAGGKPEQPRAEKKADPKQKKSKRNKKKKKIRPEEDEDEDEDGGGGATRGASRKGERDWELGAEEAAKMVPWMYLGVELHPALLWHLHRQGFYDPTPIQRRVVPKAVLGRKDIIGAAETGSGKTLAFGLPVLSEILTRRDAAAAAAAEAKREAAAGGGGGSDGDGDAGAVGAGEEEEKEEEDEGLQALVLCPTRELALQVASHLREAVRDTGLAVVAVVGGLAEVKQERQLSRRPEVVVATPGRFWEMAGSHAHLSRLETLRHLVVDEADRMLERGHYPELNRLFSMLEKAEGREEEEKGAESGVGGGRGGRFKKHQLPFDVSEGGEWSVPPEEGEEEVGGFEYDAMDESDGNDDQNEACLASGPAAPPTTRLAGGVADRGFARQTYVFSATLTLGASGRQQRKGGAATAGKKGKKAAAASEEDDAVTKIMRRVGVRGDPAVIDMGRRTVGVAEAAAAGGQEAGAGAGGGEAAGPPALPSTLKLCSIKSLQMEKDVHAYLFCATYPGRTLIFVNAIAIARRLSVLLCALNVPATPLHAQMQQRQRLKSLDRFTSDPKAVLVATDVAARGLDIPKVEHVVHYDAARSAEVFIHRAGRTARARAAGLSLSIVAPRDDANHRQTCSVLGLHDGMPAFPLDMRMVERARERVGMALRVLKFQEAQNRVSASNDFFRGLSKEADLVMDGDLLMDDAGAAPDASAQGRGGVKGLGKKGNQHAARLAAEARQALAVALSRPLHSDRRKLIPVAQALSDMRAASERTAAGDLAGKQRTRSGKQAIPRAS